MKGERKRASQIRGHQEFNPFCKNAPEIFMQTKFTKFTKMLNKKIDKCDIMCLFLINMLSKISFTA